MIYQPIEKFCLIKFDRIEMYLQSSFGLPDTSISVSTLVVQHIWQLPRSFLQSYEVIGVISRISFNVKNHGKNVCIYSFMFYSH